MMLVHNPSARKEDHPRKELLAILRLAGHDATYCSTKSDDFPDMLDEPVELIAIAGGDGTVRKVVTTLKRRDAPLSILPLGTANNVARSLGLDGDLQQLVSGWAEHRIARLDIGIAEWSGETRAFVEAVGAGALAAITSDKVGGELKGEKRLLVGRDALRERLEKAQPLDMDIEVDGRPAEGSWLLIEVLNISYTGPALPLGSRAHSGDGVLELVAVAEDRRDEMLTWLGAPDDSVSPVHRLRGSHVRLAWSGKPALRIDDKLLDIGKGRGEIDIRLQKEPLTVLLPPQDRPTPSAGVARGRRPLADA